MGKKRVAPRGAPQRAASPQTPTSLSTNQSGNHKNSNKSPVPISNDVNSSDSQSTSSLPLPPSVLHSLSKQLQCLICEDSFDEQSRKPMILHAGHTMCQICIQSFRAINPSENDVISCPFCQATCRRSEAAVNHVVLDIVKSCSAWLSASPTSADDSNKQCDLCCEEDVESEAAIYCFDCLEWMCEDHARIHGRKKDKSTHRTNTCQQIHSDPQLRRAVRSKRFPVILCQKHELKFEFYCVPCSKFLCLSCSGEHPRHNKTDLLVRFTQQTEQSEELIQAFKELEPKRQKCLELVGSNIASIETQERQELTEIEQTILSITQLIEKAKQQEQTLSSKIEEQLQSEQASRESQLQSVSAARDQLAAAISDLEHRIAKRDYITIDQSVTKLQESINQSRAALAPFVEFGTQQLSVVSDSALQSVVVALAQQLDVNMEQWFTAAANDYSIEKFLRLAAPSAASQSSFKPSKQKKKSKMAKAAANFAAQQVAQAKQEQEEQKVEAVVLAKNVPRQPQSVVMPQRSSKMNWSSLYQRVRSHASNPLKLRQLVALAEDLRMFSLNRNLDVMAIDECEFEELVMFVRANLSEKNLTLFAALSETLINLLSVYTMDCTEPWFEDDFAEIMQICMRTVRPVNQLTIQYDSYLYALAHRLSWALPGSPLKNTALKVNQKIGMYRINCNDRTDTLEGFIVPLRLNPSIKSIVSTSLPLSDKAVRALCMILEHQRNMRSLALNLNKVSPDAVASFFESLKHLPVLTSLQLEFGFTPKPILSAYLKHLFSLTTLQIHAKELGDNGVQIICEKLMQMPNLRKLLLGGCGIGNKGMTTLAQNLHKIPLLRHLSLTLNKLENETSDSGTQTLISNLKNLPHLAVLEMQHVAMKDKSFKVFGENMKFLPHLQELRLSCSDPDGPKAGFQVLCQNFQFVPRIKVLDLSSSNLDSACIDGLSSAILNGALINLDYLCLNNCDKLKPDSVRKLAESFIQLTDLRELLMSYCQLDAARCVMICEQLKHLPNLRHIDLGNNNIGGNGCRALAQNLRYCPLLETLTLETCTIDDGGLRALSASFEHVGLLQYLDLQNNKITSITSLAESLRYLPQLRELYLSSNSLSAEFAPLFKNFKFIPLLRVLELTETGMQDKQCLILVEALKNVPLLRSLVLSENHALTDTAGVALAQSLKQIPLLKELSLSETQIGNETVRVIRANVKQLNYLRLLDLANIRSKELQDLKRFLNENHPLVHLVFSDEEQDDDEEEEGEYSDED